MSGGFLPMTSTRMPMTTVLPGFVHGQTPTAQPGLQPGPTPPSNLQKAKRTRDIFPET